jgi:hypothetical protein
VNVPVRDERGPVVDEALAFDDRHDATRRTQPPHDRGRRDRVRGRDDRAEHEGRRPGQLRHDCVRDDRDGDHGQQDEPDREHPDRPHIRAQVSERREEGRRVEERRQHPDEHELGRQLEFRHARGEAEREPAEHEQDRIGDVDPRHEHE